MFKRTDDDLNEEPLRIVFLSVEGNKTERQYFEYVEKYRKTIGIKATVHVHPLRRAKKDNLSAPEDVIELLEEYILLRNVDSLPELLKDQIPKKYSDEFVAKYIKGELNDPVLKSSFEKELTEAGYDIAYNTFLKDFRGKDDIFGVLIDRDYKSHSVQQMKSLVDECTRKKYKVYISNPLFEFWLLLHLIDINDLSNEDFIKINNNETVSDRHTYTSKMVSDIAGHSKSISEDKFKNFYLPNIDKAINQSKKLEHDINKLIGNENSPRDKKGAVGSNIFELFELLRN
jgi:hypothetical protein